MTITYHRAPTELTFDVPETPLQVKLDGRITGLIRKTAGGFAYYPKGAGASGANASHWKRASARSKDRELAYMALIANQNQLRGDIHVTTVQAILHVQANGCALMRPRKGEVPNEWT